MREPETDPKRVRNVGWAVEPRPGQRPPDPQVFQKKPGLASGLDLPAGEWGRRLFPGH